MCTYILLLIEGVSEHFNNQKNCFNICLFLGGGGSSAAGMLEPGLHFWFSSWVVAMSDRINITLLGHVSTVSFWLFPNHIMSYWESKRIPLGGSLCHRTPSFCLIWPSPIATVGNKEALVVFSLTEEASFAQNYIMCNLSKLNKLV